MNFNEFKLKFKTTAKKSKDLLLKFWKSENSKISLLRDVLVAFLLVFIILIGMWTYTGQWWGSPIVAIESNSMMHLNEPFGRYGTINAGDMVFLVKTYSKSDIVTYIEKDPDNFHYGKYGDVIVYRPYGRTDEDPIIHRAMCWVEYNEEYDTYTVEGYGIYNESSITIPELGLRNYVVPGTPHSGYITKGDNPITNDRADQTSSYTCDQPIKVEWITGKARGELPWIGTLNLIFNDIFTGKNTLSNVQQDCIICLIILIVVLISIPVTLDVLSYYKQKKKRQN
jgi:signal peptidase I